MRHNHALDIGKGLAIIVVVLMHMTAPPGCKDVGTLWDYQWYRASPELAVLFLPPVISRLMAPVFRWAKGIAAPRMESLPQ